MTKRLHISTALDSKWETIADQVRQHQLWRLDPEFHPTVHLRNKTGGGISFTSHLLLPGFGINQHRVASTPSIWSETFSASARIEAVLDQAYELALFAKALGHELAEIDPYDVLDEEPSNQPWSMLMPLPMRRMLETGMAQLENMRFALINKNRHEGIFEIHYRETARTHHEVEMFELNTPRYRYFFGKSIHYLRVFDCKLPLTTQASLEHMPLSQVVDIDVFHHPDLIVLKAEQNKEDLMLHLPRAIYPSARPPL